ncbi:MAG: alpha/beta hydrolase [Alphaproteobacteria bacterium]|nr:alpha/beta hydrolase [Alphaproteobacteria bacterium]
MSVQRQPYMVVFEEETAFKDVYGGTVGMVAVEAMRIIPEENSDTAIVFSHPVGGGSFLPMVTALARAGHHVIYANTRFRGNDTALLMEKCVTDLGAVIAHAKENFGYQKIILGGWSGGGSLALFYQDQATGQRLTQTAAGDPYDLSKVDLPAAHGILLLAAHVSRAVTLTEWMDPSISDEADPFTRDPQLNIYDPDNPNQPAYAEAYVTHYRAAQLTRNRRITAWVKDTLAELRQNGRDNHERAFCVHGTMADLRWTDPTQDPSDRAPHSCYLGAPIVANDGPVGLARFTTLRSWLSQWSFDDSPANGLGNAAQVTIPALVINNTADLACTPSHAQRLFDALGSSDKTHMNIKGADHYYIERRDLLSEAVAHVSDWLKSRDFI